MVKNPPANADDIRNMDSVPESGRFPGGGHGNILHILAWRIPWAEDTVCSISESQVMTEAT